MEDTQADTFIANRQLQMRMLLSEEGIARRQSLSATRTTNPMI
jgi:hypothetical protein